MKIEKALNTAGKYTNPEVKDFSNWKREQLINICKKVNNYDIGDNTLFDNLEKFFLHLPFVNLLFGQLKIYQKCIIDSYDYSVRIINDVFNQACECDYLFAGKLEVEKDKLSISQSLIQMLADELKPGGSSYTNSDLDTRIKQLGYTNPINSDDYVWQLLKNAEENKWDNFLNNSKYVYEDAHINVKFEKRFNEYFKGHEDQYLKAFEELYNKGIGTGIDSAINSVIKEITEDEFFISLIKAALETFGITASAKAYAKLIALKQMEQNLNARYLESKENLLMYKKGADYDVKELKKVAGEYETAYNIMEKLEVEIQETYRDMNPNNADIQYECNEKILHIETQYGIQKYDKVEKYLTYVGE